MKAAILCAAIAVVLAVQDVSGKVIFNTNKPPPIIPNARARAPILKTISLPVDHFNSSDTRTWNMRYYDSDDLFIDGGPIYIYVGGEWTLDPNFILGGQIYDMADNNGGYLFTTEHRYYGESWPVSDLSTPNMKYLSVDQALADLAAFIRGLKDQSKFSGSKVVLVGGSYSATMSTWMRLKYPDLVDAAYASSAPVLALDDYKQYFEVVGENIQLESPDCWDLINEGTQAMAELFESDDGLEQLSTLVNSCNPVEAGFPNQDNFFNQIGNLFSGLVQYAQPGQIKAECQVVLNQEGSSSLEKLSAYIQTKWGGCFGDYNNALYWYTQTDLDPDSSRTWFYQTCSKFGFFQTANSTDQPFGVNWFSSLSHTFCKDAFGDDFSKENILASIDNTNRQYGGLYPNITKVISVHGKVDPWHAIGMPTSQSEEAPVILVPGYAHCADLSSISDDDSDAMANAKQLVQDTITKWIS